MNRRLPIINLFSYISLVIINLLAVLVPFFGKSPGDVSDLYPNLLTPADFTFRIWSVVYSLMGIFAFHQARSVFRKNATVPHEVSAIGLLFIATCIFNIGWLLTWQSLYIAWSFLLIFILWILLIVIYYRLAQLEKVSWFFMIPFSIYLAWICISTLANLNVLLIDIEFGFFGLTEEQWTATLVGIGIGGTLLMLYLNKDIWFTLVLIWSFFGIYMKNKQIGDGDNWVVFMSLLAMIILFIIGTGVGLIKWNRKKQELAAIEKD